MKRTRTRRGPKPLDVGAPSMLGAIPGYVEIDEDRLRIERIEGDAVAVAAETSASLIRLLRSRDSIALQAKSGEQLLKEMVPAAIGPGPSELEQVHAELLQAFALAAGPGRRVPGAPHSMVRLWNLLRRNLAAYLTDTAPGQHASADAGLIRNIRLQTVYYRNVFSSDPDTKVLYEHDVVVVLGMRVLIFEAKSGKLAAAGRRGRLASLKTDFARLFVEPGVQASRLEALMVSRRNEVILTDNKGATVRLDPSVPSVVHKFGVCIEHFASVTSSRRLFRDMGLLRSDQDWAPVLSLADLRMLSERLDTEISFLHYLTRRATADDVLDFVAEEQDLLSLYLTNGFAVETRGLEGRQVLFLQADAAVRGRASPRVDRREFATPGIDLPPLWSSGEYE